MQKKVEKFMGILWYEIIKEVYLVILCMQNYLGYLYVIFINICYIFEYFDFLLYYYFFCEKYGGNMVIMLGCGFSQLGFGFDCSQS